MLITTLVKQFELQQLEKQYLIRSHCIVGKVVLIIAYSQCKKVRGVAGRGRGSLEMPRRGST